MDELAHSTHEERRPYFEQTAAKLNLSEQLIEKDFWVCWVLRRLFSNSVLQDHLTFKGGTSLSKVFQTIERFSEDVDVSIERSHLGFGGDMIQKSRRVERSATNSYELSPSNADSSSVIR